MAKNDDGLNLNCTTHYNKWDKYLVLFANNNAAVILRTVFKNEAVGFVNYMVVDVQGVADRANADLGGITDGKDLAKELASMSVGDITSNGLSFAKSVGNSTLITLMRNSSKAKLLKEKDENFVSKCNNVNTALTAAIANYPSAIDFFTAAQLTTAMGLVGNFDVLQGRWAVAKSDKDGAKIAFEVTWIPFMEASLKFMEDLLPGAIRTGFPAFADSFIILKKLDRAGARDQGLFPTIVDAGTGDLLIVEAKMETLNYTGAVNQKSGKTSASGVFKLMKLKIGLWQIKFSAPGYEDQVIVYKIDKKTVLRPVIRMVRI